ncbi:MAG: hypothetical protein WC796_04415 [Candidatus Pacearchaeota archaeon]|jgi:hypothetical protein
MVESDRIRDVKGFYEMFIKDVDPNYTPKGTHPNADDVRFLQFVKDHHPKGFPDYYNLQEVCTVLDEKGLEAATQQSE